MKIYFGTRALARSSSTKNTKVVDAKNATSVNGSRWAVELTKVKEKRAAQ